MTKRIECCEIFLNYPTELHHIIFKSECKALENCELNHIYLCAEHHRGTYGVHGSKGNSLNKKLKLDFQNKLELLFDKEYFTKTETGQALGISERATNSLCKTILSDKGKFYRQDVIRACMGSKLIIKEDIK